MDECDCPGMLPGVTPGEIPGEVFGEVFYYLKDHLGSVRMLDGTYNVGSVTISYTSRANCGPIPPALYIGLLHNDYNTAWNYTPHLFAPFNGIIDEVKLYNRALTLGEIQKDYQRTSVVAYDDYYPFGQTMAGRSYTSITDPRYKFTEKERDVETGYDYFGARYYDSRIGRWLSVDPLAGKYPDLSPYVYCSNDPILLFDPDGKEIRNSVGYVINNQRLIDGLIEFNRALSEVACRASSTFVAEITGGDRAPTTILLNSGEAWPSSLKVFYSLTNASIIWEADPNTPHSLTNGARGVDISKDLLNKYGFTKEQIELAAARTGLFTVTWKQNGVEYRNHFHLTLRRKTVKKKVVDEDVVDKQNRPNFHETSMTLDEVQSPTASIPDHTATQKRGWGADCALPTR